MRQAIFAIVRLCVGLRLSQRKTLAEIAYGAARTKRISLAEIGRKMRRTTSVKHRIKRVDRFLGNMDVAIPEGARGIALFVAKRTKKLTVAVDWVYIRDKCILRAAMPFQGRSIPIMAAVYRKGFLRKSQNAFEETFFEVLRDVLEGLDATVVADRGFGRADLARFLQRIGFSYVIRLTSGAYFDGERYCGKLSELKLEPGSGYDLGWGLYTKTRPVRQRLIFYWRRREKEPWLLATNLKKDIERVAFIFSRRMSIEELFRDEKNLRWGWALRNLQVGSTDRLENLILALALAYLVLLLLGRVGVERDGPSAWGSASKRQVSLWRIGQMMVDDGVGVTLRELYSAFTRALRQDREANWG